MSVYRSWSLAQLRVECVAHGIQTQSADVGVLASLLELRDKVTPRKRDVAPESPLATSDNTPDSAPKKKQRIGRTRELDQELLTGCRSGTARDVARAINKGASANVMATNGNTALIVACEREDACGHEAEAIVELLVTHGALVRAMNPAGSTALHSAAYWSSAAVVEQLLVAGALVDVCEPDMSTALHWCTERDDADEAVRVARLLLDAGADANARTARQDVPLLLACRSGSAALVELLLQRGANARVVGAGRTTALMLACRNVLHGEQVTKAFAATYA